MSDQKFIDGVAAALAASDASLKQKLIDTLSNDEADHVATTLERDWAAEAIVDLKARITDLETALLAATDLAKRQCERIEELEAERDARPAPKWVDHPTDAAAFLKWNDVTVGIIEKWKDDWSGDFRGEGMNGYFLSTGPHPTPEAAKAAVEEALRGLSAKTEGA